MQLFESSLTQVSHISSAHRVGLVLRHSARYPILKDEDIYTAGLTAEGVRQAEAFGQELTKIRIPGRLFSSPIERCLDTASAIARGANWDLPVLSDDRLSHPFIQPVWNALPIYWKEDPLPKQVTALLDLVMEGEDKPGVLDIFTTHDTIVAVLACYFTGKEFHYPDYWPDYLEGVFIWRDRNTLHLQWRDETVEISSQ
jgi:hypothetical protein